jgi:hypothetical protein
MSKLHKYIIAGVSAPHKRINVAGKTYEQSDTFLVTIAATYTDAKDFIENRTVPNADVMQYLVIEEMKEMSTISTIERWYICKDKEMIQLASAPDEYKNCTSMISI